MAGKRNVPELLAPAGDMERLKLAVLYGADAIYLAGTDFGMRAFAGNFTPEELPRAVDFAHDHGVRVHCTINTMPRCDEVDRLPEHLERLNDAGVDALIVADLGAFTMAGKYAPRCQRHISTQASICNHETARAWYDLGASRVILAREVSLEEMRTIRAKTPAELEIEAFVHGAMCVSYSGRCLLSNYMTGRDSSRGACAQPCRYHYALMEEKRPGEYFPIEEDEQGSYILNSRDMCMIDHLDDLIDVGLSSLKIEGRAKSAYYAAIVTGAYRHCLDDAAAGRPIDPVWRDEVEHVSHRPYSTGFYYGEPGQYYANSRYVREWQVVALVMDCDAEGNATLSLRNKFRAGDELELVGPDLRPFTVTAPMMTDGEGAPLEEPRTPRMVFRMQLPRQVPPMTLVRHSVELSAKSRRHRKEETTMNVDVVIVGAGPAGIFTALEMIKKGSRQKIVMVEKGQPVEKRHCPKDKTKKCVNCKPYCHITTGFSGAGAFSDGKLSLSYEVGGDLPSLIGEDLAQETINYADKIYLEFGADTHIEGLEHEEERKEIRKHAIQAGLKLVDCPIRHMGTEKAQEIYLAIEKYLQENGVEMYFGYECSNLILENDECHGVSISDGKTDLEIYAKHTVVATGRRGADWLERLCAEHNIAHAPGTVDIGVRVEVRNEVMETVNRVLYESKLVGYPKPFKNKVRTFCQNPGGFVSQENYDNNLAVVNGHSYKDLKSDNTNLSILCSHNFSVPFNQPIAYAQKVGELTNMLANGQILVQRFGDILDGKRTWQKELAQSNIKPTLPDAVAGDITAAMPYRAMVNIINFIQAMDHVVPGFASTETLLYSPELKFYSNRVKMDTDFNTSLKGLHCLGDSSGWTRGLMMASIMGVLMGRKIAEEG